MATANYAVSVTVGSVTIARQVNRQASGEATADDVIPGAKEGVLTTRTDNDTGEITADDHGITTGDVVDLYWDGGRRYGVLVGTVAGDVIPIDGGTGDNLPTQSDLILIAKQSQVNIGIDGDEALLFGVTLDPLGAEAPPVGHADFQDADDDSIFPVDLIGAPVVVDIAAGGSNPLTGDPIVKAMVTTRSLTGARVKIVCLQDATP